MMMERSETLGELFKALSKAQGQIQPAVKDAVNPHLKSKYADLGSVWEACRAALAENGLSVSQWPVNRDGVQGVTIITMLGHTSGEFMSTAFTMPTMKADAQGYGGALTYARRYCLSAVLGIVADDDDDGHAASAPRGTQARQQAPARTSTPPRPAEAATVTQAGTLSADQAKRLHAQLGAMLQETRYREVTHNAFAAQVIGREVASLTELTPAEAKEVYSAAQVAQQEAQAA